MPPLGRKWKEMTMLDDDDNDGNCTHKDREKGNRRERHWILISAFKKMNKREESKKTKPPKKGRGRDDDATNDDDVGSGAPRDREMGEGRDETLT